VLTGCVVFVREVGAIVRAGREDAPKGAAIEAVTEPGQVYVPGQATLLKRLGEVLCVDLVIVERAKEKSKVVVSIYTRSMSDLCSLSRCGLFAGDSLPIRGVVVRMVVTLCSIE